MQDKMSLAEKELKRILATCTLLSAPSKRSRHAPPFSGAVDTNSNKYKQLAQASPDPLSTTNSSRECRAAAGRPKPLAPHLESRLAASTGRTSADLPGNIERPLPPHLRHRYVPPSATSVIKTPSPIKPMVRRRYIITPYAQTGSAPITAKVVCPQDVVNETPLIDMTGIQALEILSKMADSGQLSLIVKSRRGDE